MALTVVVVVVVVAAAAVAVAPLLLLATMALAFGFFLGVLGLSAVEAAAAVLFPPRGEVRGGKPSDVDEFARADFEPPAPLAFSAFATSSFGFPMLLPSFPRNGLEVVPRGLAGFSGALDVPRGVFALAGLLPEEEEDAFMRERERPANSHPCDRVTECSFCPNSLYPH